MTPDRELFASAERMAALANSALKLMSSSLANAQSVTAQVASDVLELAELMPSDLRDDARVCGAVERARLILGPTQPNERH